MQKHVIGLLSVVFVSVPQTALADEVVDQLQVLLERMTAQVGVTANTNTLLQTAQMALARGNFTEAIIACEAGLSELNLARANGDLSNEWKRTFFLSHLARAKQLREDLDRRSGHSIYHYERD